MGNRAQNLGVNRRSTDRPKDYDSGLQMLGIAIIAAIVVVIGNLAGWL